LECLLSLIHIYAEVRTRTGYKIAEFSPAGLNLDEVRHACDLTPHKP